VTAWEYAIVVLSDVLKKVTSDDPEYEHVPTPSRWVDHGRKYAWFREQKLHIWLPERDEPEVRVVWTSGEQSKGNVTLSLFNELGADGWELVDRHVRASAVTSNRGWTTSSFPTETMSTFKRPKSDG
jgi:hypothetical protein